MKKNKNIIGIAIVVLLLGIFLMSQNSAGDHPEKTPEGTSSLIKEQNGEEADETQSVEEEADEMQPVGEKEDEIQSVEEESDKEQPVFEKEAEKDTHQQQDSAPLENEEESVSLEIPFEIPEYDMVIEAIGSYTGIYVEDGTNEEVSGIAMIQLKNSGTSVIEYAELQLEFSTETLHFKISALPAGERVVLLEQQRKAVPKEQLQGCTATVVQRESMGMSEDQVLAADKAPNTLEIKNLTEETIPAVRIFYKYYMEDKNMFLGGIAFSVKLTDLGAEEELVIQPAHYKSDSCRIVMISTYDTTS